MNSTIKQVKHKQKDRERILVERFISNPILPDPVVGIDEGEEPPDFGITMLSGKEVSIEVTELYDQHLKQRYEFQDKIISLAEEKFLERYGVFLRVLITFSNVPMKGRSGRLDGLVNMIFDYVETIYLNNRYLEFRVSTRDEKPVNKYIKSISINNDMPFSAWQSFSGFKVDYVDPSWIVERIRRKEKGLMQYSHVRDENWLLLVAGFGSKDSAFRFENLMEAPLVTQFDKIFILEYFVNQIHLVETLKPQ